MPTSSKDGKNKILEWIKNTNNIGKILDIGCGEGTYPSFCKTINNITLDSEWWGIEAWEPYIKNYNLENLYDNIINADARNIDWNKFPYFDLIICGDVLEHMTKEESQELVKSALARTKKLIISIPIRKSKQGAWGGNPFEIHVKENWSHNEVLESFPNIIDFATTKKIGVYFLSGNDLKKE